MNHLRHLALIMDGNGRWAKERGKQRIKGHEKGAETLREITMFCSKSGLEFLSLYAFSTDAPFGRISQKRGGDLS